MSQEKEKKQEQNLVLEKGNQKERLKSDLNKNIVIKSFFFVF